MDSWSEIQIKKMESGGNESLNSLLSQYGISKETDIISKYNTKAVSVYPDRIQTLAKGRTWRDLPVVKETLNGGGGSRKPPLRSGGGGKDNGGWNSWDNDDSFRSTSSDMRRNQSANDFREGRTLSGVSVRSKSTDDMYTRSQLEQSTANKESFFAKRIAENESRSDGLTLSQGEKYVGFGSSPTPIA